jgi:type I protein arginine methyltransferase
MHELLSVHRVLLGHTSVRLEKFREAIVSRVKPGDTVLDLGTGTGIFAFFACQAGARRVYAVEASPVIELARILARENNLENQIVFVEGSSLDIELPERVDVLVSDTFSLWKPDTLRSVIDARDRLVKPGGALIPTSIELFVAPVDEPDMYHRHVDFWDRGRDGIDFSVIRDFAVNQCYPVKVEAPALLAESVPVAQVTLSGTGTVVLRGEVCLTVRRAGTVHGICAWFASRLADDITVSNCPGATTTNYAQAFFPVARPTSVVEGDRIGVFLMSHDGIHWRWRVDIEAEGGTDRVVRFDHSTFLGIPLTGASFRNLEPDRVPTLSRRGQAELYLLGLSDGANSIEELRQQLRQRYPDLFKSPEDVSVFVADVLARSA